ncbi:MAG: flotillin family protein [Gammaproteobacteria bacterium]|nr:flotillin family protein [Gammaproteobacteria bacterium]MCF6261571.1 flotillin family protein [Gammaproteobacteria bacterium]
MWFETGIMIAVVAVIAILAIGIIFTRLYTRSTKEKAYVRTGLGGQKVIKDGGAIVVGMIHEITQVNMKTLRLEVPRQKEDALITKDRLRVDVTAEFYVRVKPDDDAIAAAAQTLGDKTFDPNKLRTFVEAKFVDALRSVAAGMEMMELHEQRSEFVQKVQDAVAEDLRSNGLELEAVSLTALDQTSLEFFNENNAFDAEGLLKVNEVIEDRRKQRNDIVRDTEVAINQKDLESQKLNLEIKREAEYARLEQEREVQMREASQQAAIAQEQAEKKRESDQTQIAADQAVEASHIAKQKAIREQEIEKERAIESADIKRAETIQIAEQEREIAVANKSKEQSVAAAEADKARAGAVQAAEQVTTVKMIAEAERKKAVELLKAKELAEKNAIGIKVAAEAEKAAAEDRADAVRIEAAASAEQVTIAAEAAAEAKRLNAEADARRLAVEAEGRTLLHEASNKLNKDQIELARIQAVIDGLPAIIKEAAEPMKNIDSLKVIDLNGLSRSESSSGDETVTGASNMADHAVNSMLRYRTQKPVVDALLSELGLDSLDNLSNVTSGILNKETSKASVQSK